MEKRMRIAILGSGGLGRNTAKILSMKKEFQLVGICDSKGIAFSEEGLDPVQVASMPEGSSVAELSHGKICKDSLQEMIGLSGAVDGIFVALPNLPNTFIPDVTRRFLEGGYQGVFSDVLKRTSAVENLFQLDNLAKEKKSVYLTGCGATPGLLSAAAVLAAQSFVEVENVDIYWGVGIPSWEQYRGKKLEVTLCPIAGESDVIDLRWAS